MAESIVTVSNLIKYFPVVKGIVFEKKIGDVKAVDDISFDVYRGETLGLVGESGCGKTTAGRTILGLYPATSGRVVIDNHDVCTASGAELKTIRRKAQMIFQDPYASLNPRWTVNAIISEPLKVHNLYQTEKERTERVIIQIIMVTQFNNFSKVHDRHTVTNMAHHAQIMGNKQIG